MDYFDYVSFLTEKEKLIFVKLIIFLVGKDGVIDEEEKGFIKELARYYHISSDYSYVLNRRYMESELFDELKKINLERHKALFLIKELLGGANSNNILSDDEVDFIVRISKLLNIEGSKVAAINQLILDRQEWVERCRLVFETDQLE